MREIKFRAWIHKLNKWADCVNVHSGGGFYAYWSNVQYVNADLEQYTGLKDKNGKEIYEGDIVDNSGLRLFVCFLDGAFCLCRLQDMEYYDDIANTQEVIGNIHENQELLA